MDWLKPSARGTIGLETACRARGIDPRGEERYATGEISLLALGTRSSLISPTPADFGPAMPQGGLESAKRGARRFGADLVLFAGESADGTASVESGSGVGGGGCLTL